MTGSGAMYALTQLQAEVERLQREVAFIRESYGVVRRAMGIFYVVGRQDRDAETPGRRGGRHRHLKSLNLGCDMMSGHPSAFGRLHCGVADPARTTLVYDAPLPPSGAGSIAASSASSCTGFACPGYLRPSRGGSIEVTLGRCTPLRNCTPFPPLKGGLH